MDLDLYDLNIWQKLWNESTLILKSRFANIDTVVYVVLFWRKRTTRVSMSAENKERLCGDNINDRSVCGQTRLSLQQIHLQNKCINVLILRPESALPSWHTMESNGLWNLIFVFLIFQSRHNQYFWEKKSSKNSRIQMLLHKFYGTNVFAILSNIPDISSQELVLCQRGS